MAYAFRRLGSRLLFAALGLLCAAAAFSQPALTLNVARPDQVGLAGSTFTFQGSVFNNTGRPVSTADLFFNFARFDPVFIAPHQLLGDVPVTFANGVNSPLLGLFSVDLAAGASPGSVFPIDVLLVDDAGNLAGPRSVTVSVIPEPSPLALIVLGLGPIFAALRRRSTVVRRTRVPPGPQATATP